MKQHFARLILLVTSNKDEAACTALSLSAFCALYLLTEPVFALIVGMNLMTYFHYALFKTAKEHDTEQRHVFLCAVGLATTIFMLGSIAFNAKALTFALAVPYVLCRLFPQQAIHLFLKQIDCRCTLCSKVAQSTKKTVANIIKWAQKNST